MLEMGEKEKTVDFETEDSLVAEKNASKYQRAPSMENNEIEFCDVVPAPVEICPIPAPVENLWRISGAGYIST